MNKDIRKIRLLLVDDEEEFLIASSQALGRRNLDVRVALNGVTALEILEKEEYDVVVLDVKMPDIDGIEVFRQVREKYPGLPVILLTGHSSIDDAFQTSRDGVADYLTKPIDMDELANRIKNAACEKQPESDEKRIDTIIRVMLIDDEVEFLESMKKILQRRQMEVTTVDSGEKALSCLREALVDVAILDVKMPGMDGLEVLRQIKQEFPSVEVILLTGHPSVEAAIEGIQLGADEYLKKPPEVDELVATIHKLFQNRKKILMEQQQKLIEEIRKRYPD